MKITRAVLDQVIRDCWSMAPREACGLLSSSMRLAGQPVVLDGFHPMGNASEFPRHRFELDGETLIALYGELEALDRMPRVVYHSHPVSPAYPSEHDIRYAVDDSGLWHLIVSLAGLIGPEPQPVIRLFEIKGGVVIQQPLTVLDETLLDSPPVEV